VLDDAVSELANDDVCDRKSDASLPGALHATSESRPNAPSAPPAIRRVTCVT
jgi:hypothetical protein